MPNPSWPRSSLPTSASPTPGERTYPEVARGDEYPEVITEPQLNPYAYNTQQSPSILGEKEKYDPARSRVGSYKILGLRSWVLVVLVCVVAISVALAVGLAIGLPASKRSNGSINPAAQLPSADALAASTATNSKSLVRSATSSFQASASPTAKPTSSFVTSASPIAKPISQSPPKPASSIISCPANDTNTYIPLTDDPTPIPYIIQSQTLKYRIHCNQDYRDSGSSIRDMQRISVNSFAECLDRCSIFNEQLPVYRQTLPELCSGVTLNQGDCFLKSGLREGASSDLWKGTSDSAILIWSD